MQRRGALFGMPGGSGSRKMAAGDIGELLVPHMPTIRVPRSGDRVYKNECAFSYDSPVSETRRQEGASGEVAVPAALGGRESPNSAAREARGEGGRRCAVAAGDRLLRAPEMAQGHSSSANT